MNLKIWYCLIKIFNRKHVREEYQILLGLVIVLNIQHRNKDIVPKASMRSNQEIRK